MIKNLSAPARDARPGKARRRIPFDKFEFLRHYLLVPGEDEKELKSLHNASFRRLAPCTHDERVTVNGVVMQLWQVRRWERKLPAAMAEAVNRRKGSPQCRLVKLQQLYLADAQRRLAAATEHYYALVRQRLEAPPDAATPAPALPHSPQNRPPA